MLTCQAGDVFCDKPGDLLLQLPCRKAPAGLAIMVSGIVDEPMGNIVAVTLAIPFGVAGCQLIAGLIVEFSGQR